MAKKKAPKKKAKKISRVGAVNKQAMGDFFVNVLEVVGTTLLSEYGDKLIPDSWDIRLVGGTKALAGALLPLAAGKNPKNKQHLLAIGNVLLSQGTKQTAKGFGILSGAEDGSDLYIAMSGDDLKIINGNVNTEGSGGNVLAGDNMSIINGNDDDDIN